MILMIDNYDSFVYNLVQLFREIGGDVKVVRNDEVTVDEIRTMKPSHLVVSPGPCTPAEAGVSVDAIRELGKEIPTLGVCLGHEAVGAAFGAKLVRADRVYHGKTSDIVHDGRTMFAGLDSPMTVGRYHSLVLAGDTIPDELEVTARAEDGTVMAVRHRTRPIEGVQFHPESILTPQGRWLCENFLSRAKRRTTVRAAIARAIDGHDLETDEAQDVMGQVLSGQATPAQIAALITAVRLKGETKGEVTGFARAMRGFAAPFSAPVDAVDTCGTGGDGAGTFNISTVAALVAAGAGCRVAKHGNRSVSSLSGSADVLVRLGVNIAAPANAMERALNEAGIAFLFAPAFHGAMKHAMGPRKEIGVRTVFNMLGPLTNPAGAKRQLLGVFDGKLTELFAEVLLELGTERAMVVHGADGLDEITLTGPTRVTELKEGEIATSEIAPEDFGLMRCSPNELAGGSPEANATIARSVLDGETGPRRDAVLINAAAAIACAGRAVDLAQGLTAAAQSIDSGAAKMVLDRLVEITNG